METPFIFILISNFLAFFLTIYLDDFINIAAEVNISVVN